jgi:glyoxylase-like metal-dependent hydrolase (beta-lactamase superfamily II)
MGKNPFILDYTPEVGVAEAIAPGLRRITAPNASPMTFRGTNTYLLGENEIAVIDPGPVDAAHLEAILLATGGGARISHILVTHSHVDHSPLARRLSELTGAPVLAFGDTRAGRSARMVRLAGSADLGGGEGVDMGFRPDIFLTDGENISSRDWTLTALTTPGHFGNHLCFTWEAEAALFSGDHVMSWATTLVSPPDGDLGAFMGSLRKLAGREAEQRYFPGHGAPLDDPQGMINHQISHRRMRESQILSALDHGPASARHLAERIYTEIPTALIPAASRNVFAHLIDLLDKNRVELRGNLAADSRFALVRPER